MSAMATKQVKIKDLSYFTLLCPAPGCNDHNLHQEAVRVEARPNEDGPGTIVQIDSTSMHVEAAKPDEFIGRRNGVMIDFWCENCSGPDEHPIHTLVIVQHKGMTFVSWANGEPPRFCV